MTKWKAPRTEAEFIARCDREAAKQRAIVRHNAIARALDEIAEQIEAGIEPNTWDAAFLRETAPDLMWLVELQLTDNLKGEAYCQRKKASDLCDAQDDVVKLLRYQPVTLDGAFAAAALSIEWLAKDGAAENDFRVEVSRAGRQFIAAAREKRPAISRAA